MKKLLIAVAVLVVILIAVRQPLLTRVLERGIEARLNADIIDTLEDGLHVTLCGAGGPLPAPNASGPCVVVVAGKDMFLVDAGTDGVRNLGRMGFQAGGLDGVFLTHFHSDHIDTLGEAATMRWAGGDNDAPLPVYGPTGVEKVVEGFNLAYSQDFVYRHEHHTDLVAPMKAAGMTALPFDKPDEGELATVYEGNGLTVQALAVEHEPVKPAVGYLFTYKGRTALITGDTNKSANIQKFSEGIDLLVHEALAPNIVMIMHEAAKSAGNEILAKITYDILDYHASPVQAAETARDANVGHLLYYHVVPPLIVPGMKALWLDGAEDIFDRYTVGQDGSSFTLPANSDEIIESERM